MFFNKLNNNDYHSSLLILKKKKKKIYCRNYIKLLIQWLSIQKIM